jgi:uncharacterized damage-inducible protein DinB
MQYIQCVHTEFAINIVLIIKCLKKLKTILKNKTMKKIILLIVAILSINFSVNAQEETKSIADEMVVLMTSMKNYTLALANQMPADKFEYKPEANDVRTFAQHYKHIRNFMGFQLLLLNNKQIDLQSLIAKNKAYEKTLISKEKVIENLSTKFDEVITFYKTTSDKNLKETYQFMWEPNKPNRSRLLITMALRDHISHHRAQSIIYLRENGIKPSQYQRY